jgi:hypothetical protein
MTMIQQGVEAEEGAELQPILWIWEIAMMSSKDTMTL